MKQIIVKIENGEAVITTKGFTGKACAAATAALEKALGKTTSDMPTAEMNASVAAHVKQS
ncbi:MAG: DUF2997 domain-containing protein [Vicinamibacterales bacterium]|nr:DUF2997 domain-containing protein [Vicinamibacterales bacterium]